MSIVKAIRSHKKTAAVALAGTLLVVAALAFSLGKHVAPLSWGWYGPVDEHDGLALRGYDAVALHGGRLVAGAPDFGFSWRGAEWRFASADAREAFRADPERFAPAFGGFCSFAVSRGFTATADPRAHHVYEDTLFVFDSADFRDEWVSALPGSLEQSRDKWATR
jgi:hypothetical protein